MKKILITLLVVSPRLVFCQQEASYAKQIQEFDRYVQSAMASWTVPGLSVAIVKDNKVIFKKGYGVRQLGYPAKVDTQTLFACASTTKAMTATCMGMLVDEGKLSWNDPVINYLPDFRLYDPFVTRELKIRDLFIHDSGLGNADFLWVNTDYSSDEVLRHMSLVKPSYSFRSSFIYQNLFYLVAGKVIEKISGQPWQEFIRKRIFDPLGMTRTQPMLQLVSDANQAKPHMFVEGSIMTIENTSADAIGPAGSVWSCADDMSKWVASMLDSGKYNGGRLLKPATWMEIMKPQLMVPPNEFYPTMQLLSPNWTTYGLGWFQHDYKGKKINFHTGSLAGSVALHAQIPEEKIGIYIFANFDHAEVRHALVYKAFDLFALGGNRDWSSEFQKLYAGIREKADKAKLDYESARIPNTNPSLPLSAYAGKFKDPLYGDVEVTVAENRLLIELNHFVRATVEHWHYDTFYGNYEKRWYGKAKVVFTMNALGKVEKMNLDGMEFSKVK